MVIAIIDDHDGFRELLTEFVDSLNHNDMEVQGFSNGQDFIAWLDEIGGHEVDIILLDHELDRDMNGEDIFTALKEKELDHLVYGISAEKEEQGYLPAERVLGKKAIMDLKWLEAQYQEHKGNKVK